MQVIDIQGELRSGTGKRAVKDLRGKGNIPCVIYGGKENIHFEAPPATFKQLVYTPDFKIVNLQVAGKSYRCILKDIQFHPVNDQLQHLDFLELADNKKVKCNIPVRTVGVSPGVKSGGKLMQSLRRVTIKAYPKDIMDMLKVDISHLELRQIIRIRDIKLPDGVEVLANGSIPVVMVEIPRALKTETPAAGAAAPAAPAK